MLRRARLLLNDVAPGKGEAYGKPMATTPKSDPGPDFMYHAGAEKLQNKLNQLKNREWKHRYTLPYWRAAFSANAGGTIILFAVGVSTFFVAVPWIFYQWSEVLGFDIEMIPSDRILPSHTPPWWLNEWRKHLTPWKGTESWQENTRFHVRAFEWLYRCTGRDMLRPDTWNKNNNDNNNKNNNTEKKNNSKKETLPFGD